MIDLRIYKTKSISGPLRAQRKLHIFKIEEIPLVQKTNLLKYPSLHQKRNPRKIMVARNIRYVESLRRKRKFRRKPTEVSEVDADNISTGISCLDEAFDKIRLNNRIII